MEMEHARTHWGRTIVSATQALSTPTTTTALVSLDDLEYLAI